MACQKEGKEAVYYGETSRTAYERGLEHGNDHATKKEESHMYLHEISEHRDSTEKVEFSMEVIKMNKSAFERQIYEAVIIQMNEGKNLLNARGEYNRCKLPRLGAMLGDHEMKEGIENKYENEAEKDGECEIDLEIQKKRKENIQPSGRESKRRRKNKSQVKLPIPAENNSKKRKRNYLEEQKSHQQDQYKEKYPSTTVQNPETRLKVKNNSNSQLKENMKNFEKVNPEKTKVRNIVEMFNLLSEKQKLDKSNQPTLLPFPPKLKKENNFEKLSPSSKPKFKSVSKSGGVRKLKQNYKAKANTSQAQQDLRSYFIQEGMKSSRVQQENKAHPHSNLSPVFRHPHNCSESDKKLNSEAAQSKTNTRGGLMDQLVNTQKEKTSTESDPDAIKT